MSLYPSVVNSHIHSLCPVRWEEDRKDDGTKWKFLEHSGPMFAPPYEPLPDDVKFYYDGKEMKLSLGAEEVATFYARMIEHDYTTRDIFNRNFMKVRSDISKKKNPN